MRQKTIHLRYHLHFVMVVKESYGGRRKEKDKWENAIYLPYQPPVQLLIIRRQ